MKDLTREQLEAFYADSLAINATLRGENERLKKHVNDYAQSNESLKNERDALVAQLHELNKLHSDLTNADGVSEDGERVGYLITNEQLDEFENLLVDPQQCLLDVQAEVAEKYYFMGWEHSLSTKAEDGDHYGCGKRLAKQFAEAIRQGGAE